MKKQTWNILSEAIKENELQERSQEDDGCGGRVDL
jgi:hypothetical protein